MLTIGDFNSFLGFLGHPVQLIQIRMFRHKFCLSFLFLIGIFRFTF